MPLVDDLENLKAEAARVFASVADAGALEAARIDFLGTRGRLKALLGRMGEVPKEEKPAVGKRANETGAEIQASFEAAKSRLSGGAVAAAGSDSTSSLESLRKERQDKLARYQEKMGKDAAWGSRFPDPKSGNSLTSIEEIRKRFAAMDPARDIDAQTATTEVHLAARIMLRRDQSKKLIFLTVQDQGAGVQVALWNSMLDEETLALLRDTLDLWDIVGITGKLAFTQKGEPTVWATSAKILTKCLTPPPDKHHGLHDKEIRYRQRYVDLIATPESRKTFILRSKAIAGMRRFLDEQGFLEMETPVLQTIPGGAAARPFETKLNALNMNMFLRIATEIPLKKLLVGGLEKVYELGRIFRNEGIDARHNPEFTSVELYQAYGDLRDMMALTETAVSHLAQSLTGSSTVTWRGKPIKLGAPWPRLDYCELLLKHAGVGYEDVAGLDRKLIEKGIDPAGLSHVDKIDGVFSEYAESHLQDACFIVNQPLPMSPLCRAHPVNPNLADRFEAFAAGMEIANAYTELNDPAEQRKRLRDQLRQLWLQFLRDFCFRVDILTATSKEKRDCAGADCRKMLDRVEADALWFPDAPAMKSANDMVAQLLNEEKTNKKKQIAVLREQAQKLIDPSNSVDEDFLTALEYGMPPAGGLGIGIDRVIMLLAGGDSIRDVILFPLMRLEQEGGGAEAK